MVEIFSSAQGEGPYVGVSTLFVRFGVCDLRCAWCDSAHTWRAAAECRIETESGTGRFRTVPNPVDVKTVADALDSLGADRHRFVSLTGGEPLLQPEAVSRVAAAVHERGGRVYLETHGLAIDAMTQVAAHVDVVSMDWKLASEVRRAGQPSGARRSDFDDLHEGFLRAALRSCEVFVKLVLAPSTREAEFDEVCRRLEEVAPQTLLVLQPVTPCGSVREAVPAERLLAWLRRAEERLEHVRLVPQTHKLIGAL